MLTYLNTSILTVYMLTKSAHTRTGYIYIYIYIYIYRERERERERETDRQTDRQTERRKERKNERNAACTKLIEIVLRSIDLDCRVGA